MRLGVGPAAATAGTVKFIGVGGIFGPGGRNRGKGVHRGVATGPSIMGQGDAGDVEVLSTRPN
ncbi:hypothetical protein C7271_16595 [filamentous cyanobacterium CCP5]|nr:hypothetical protein C7271_16595 [filamentous cyanobacterium CCP5]